MCGWLQDYFSRFGVPVSISSDGAPEFVARETQDFFKRWGVKHRLSPAYLAQRNGRAEVTVKGMKRLTKDGSVDNDKFVRAMLTKRNTPDQFSKLSPAELVMGRKLCDNLPMIPKDMMVMNNPAVSQVWRDLWYMREKVLRDRCCKDLESIPSGKSSLKPLKVGQRVLIQNQHGNNPLPWEKSGIIVEVFPYDQYIVRVDGSGRVTRRNRRFLRSYTPAVNNDRLGTKEDDTEPVPAPHWGARSDVSESIPANVLSGPARSGEFLDPVPDDGLGGHDHNLPGQVGDEVDRDTSQPDPTALMMNFSPEPARDIPVLRRSIRATKGQSSKYQGFLTGQEYDEAEG